MDCKNDVQEGVNCYRLLVDEKNVAAIVGPPLSNPALAWVDLSTEDEIPIVGHFMDERCTTNENTGEPYPYMFLAEPGLRAAIVFHRGLCHGKAGRQNRRHLL